MNSIKSSSFKERLNKALNIRVMKATDLADKVNTSRALISTYLSGKAEPRHDRLDQISLVLNVSPVWLMGYDVPMERDEVFFQEIKKDETIPILHKLVLDSLKNLTDEKLYAVISFIKTLQ